MHTRAISPSKLARALGVPLESLQELGLLGLDGYRRWILPGPKGRQVSEPVPALKDIQGKIVRRILSKVPPHGSAGHVRRRGALWTVHQHSRKRFLIQRDVADFFPSVRPDDVARSLARVFPSETAEILTLLVTDGVALPQGAPTSVAVADMVLFPLDRRIARMAARHHLAHTRYIDDIALSGNGRSQADLLDVLDECVYAEGWKLNGKGGLFGPGDRHQYLGTVMNERPNATREYVGSVRSVLRLLSSGRRETTPEEMRSIAGKVYWIVRMNSGRAAALVPLLELAESRLSRTHQHATP